MKDKKYGESSADGPPGFGCCKSDGTFDKCSGDSSDANDDGDLNLFPPVGEPDDDLCPSGEHICGATDEDGTDWQTSDQAKNACTSTVDSDEWDEDMAMNTACVEEDGVQVTTVNPAAISMSQQCNSWCWAASTQMVLSALGLNYGWTASVLGSPQLNQVSQPWLATQVFGGTVCAPSSPIQTALAMQGYYQKDANPTSRVYPVLAATWANASVCAKDWNVPLMAWYLNHNRAFVWGNCPNGTGQGCHDWVAYGMKYDKCVGGNPRDNRLREISLIDPWYDPNSPDATRHHPYVNDPANNINVGIDPAAAPNSAFQTFVWPATAVGPNCTSNPSMHSPSTDVPWPIGL